MSVDDPTLRLKIELESSLQDTLIAELEERGFDAFEQEDDVLFAFGETGILTDDVRRFLGSWLVEHGAEPDFELETIEARNWNEAWEKTITPQEVGRFVIRPSWAADEPFGDRIAITIDPKMSFGTGYHPSTRLVLRMLPTVIKRGQRVLDAGTGTGVLAIAAAKLGAGDVFAFDNDPWPIRNATENIGRNGVIDVVRTGLGDIDCVPDAEFDVILANIQLSVIRIMLPDFVQRLVPDGHIVVSGLLLGDKPRILALIEGTGLSVEREASEGDWWAAVIRNNRE